MAARWAASKRNSLNISIWLSSSISVSFKFKGADWAGKLVGMVERKAVVLLSGGLDSSTVVAIAKSQGFSVYALSFDYGQTHKTELQAAARVAATIEVARHIVLKIDLGTFGGSALTSDLRDSEASLAEAMGRVFRSRMCPQGIRCSFRWRWPGRRLCARPTSYRGECAGLQRISGLQAGVHRCV